MNVRSTHVEAASLSGEAPADGVHAGAFAGTTVRPGSGWLGIGVRVRVDRDGWTSRKYASHALTASATHGAVTVDLAQRSSFSPPTLADQYFAEGVGVRPNPKLRAERTPSEVELGVRYSAAEWRVGGSLYTGDVIDLIVWQPDFRFIWSPANADVRRRGAELWSELRGRVRPWRVSAAYSHARIVYDRPGEDDSVQVAYRPRNSATLAASWSGARIHASMTGRYIGQRFPVPAPLNPLPGFWSWDAAVGYSSRVAGWNVETRVRVRRFLDERQTLIFDFPDPGRTVELGLELTPQGNNQVLR